METAEYYLLYYIDLIVNTISVHIGLPPQTIESSVRTQPLLYYLHLASYHCHHGNLLAIQNVCRMFVGSLVLCVNTN